MKKHSVIIRDATDLPQAIAEIFKLLGPTDLARRSVFVKPNILRAARVQECVVTDPRLISETVSFLQGAGAQVMVGDNPMPDQRSSSEGEIAGYCGIVDAAGNTYRNIGRYPKKMRKPNNLLREFYVSREILDCDLLVSLPKYKSHELTTMTLAVKNHFGIIPGGFKPAIHALFPRIDDFSRVIVEIYETRPPDVIIVDCMEVIDAQGKRYRPGMIIGGDNGHAVDYACALMAGIDPLRVPTVRVAREQGLFAPEMIEYNGAFRRIHGFSLPFVFPFRNSIVEFVSRILYRIWMGRVPVIDADLCSGCRSCENVCPPRAIKGKCIDYSKCIKCYCCLEVCPRRAIRIRYKLV
ncbi:DUF362 domain-containing protein [candidate division WOR-3 bacterium]|nr:DUF362 domain-containing protein [candidate division WOR-3 bacterium]